MFSRVVARLSSLRARLVGVFRSRRIDDDLDAEFQAHIDMRTDLLIAQGWAPAAARAEAMRRFGNRGLVKEDARSEELLPHLDSLVQDVRYGLRLFRRSPGFSSIAVLVLGLGIGLNTAMFSLFHHVLLAPLPFPDAGRLYVLSSHSPSLGDARRASSGPDFRDYRDQNAVFTSVAAVIPRFTEVWTGDGEPRVVNCAAPTVDFFKVLGVRPVMGRVFVPSEFQDLHNETLVISWNFWKNQLGGDPNVIGRTLRLEDVASTIVGVLPPMPDLYSDVDVWLKLTTEPAWPYMNWRANKFLDVIGRLKAGTDPRGAERQLTSILRRAVGEPADVMVALTPLHDYVAGPVARQLDIVMSAAILVLLVTLLNASAILLARSIRRSPELALRVGLGASRARIRRQLLIEGLLLCIAGGGLGIVLAFLTVGAVRQLPVAIPRMSGVHLDPAAIGVTVALVFVTSILFALLPDTLLKLDVVSGLRGGRTVSAGAQRPFSVLIVAEVACAVLLTVCAGLLLRSFQRIRDVSLGYQPERVVSAYLRNNYANARGLPFWHDVLATTRALPGVSSAAISDCVPSGRTNAADILFGGRPNVPGQSPSTEACWVSDDYFATLGVPLVHGRYFSSRDDASAPPVAIINAAAARRLYPGEDPLGKRIAVNYLALGSRMKDSVPRMREIVGVVSDFRQQAVEKASSPAVYLPYTQDETFHVLNSMYVFVRSARAVPDAASLGAAIRTGVQSTYPNQPVERIRALRQVIAESVARRTYATMLMTGFALLALLLSGLGIYGVVSYVMQHRTREFGIRMALGAQRRDVLRLVLRHGGVLVGAGVLVGSALSLLVTGVLSELLFETVASDPAVYVLAALALLVTGVAACLVPALRAARIDPRLALNAQ